MKQSTVRLAAFFRLDLVGCTRRVAREATMQSVSTPQRRTRQQDRIIAVATAAPGWVARFVDEDAQDGMWVQAVPVWALMQDVDGRTWVAGIDVIGEGAGGRPCDEMGNFHDYLFQPDRSLPMPGQQSSEGRSPST